MTPKKLLDSIQDSKIRQYVEDELAICKQHRIKVIFKNDSTVDYNGTGCSGWFQDDPEVLAVAVGKPIEEWLPVFVHETCHRDQCIEKDPTWGQSIKTYFDANTILDMWVHRAVELKKKQLREVVAQIVNNELDCEKRSVAKLIKYKLPIATDEYIQKSNAYVYYYHAVAATRQYATKDSPYSNRKLWSKMPVDFDQDYSKISNKLLKLYLKHCW